MQHRCIYARVRAREFHSAALGRALSEVRRATRDQVQDHVLELRGICERCRK
jgi:Fe2+ or Zn2+ uptake regulation protein